MPASLIVAGHLTCTAAELGLACCMSKTLIERPAIHTTSPHSSISLNQVPWVVLLAIFLSSFPALGDEKEDEYLRIYDIVQSADTLNTAGKSTAALAKYREADTALVAFKRKYPEWNPSSVSYRLNYLATKITEVSGKISNATAASPAQVEPQSPGSGSLNVKLLDVGGEPRAVLRLHPKTADNQVLGMSMRPTLEMKMGEMTNPPMKMPGMNLVLDVSVKDVSPGGDIAYQIVFADATPTEDAGGDPQMTEAIKSALSRLKGLSGNGTVSDRGFDKGSQFKVPADVNPQARQAFQQLKETFSNLTIPLPEEAIGPGAKWEARSKVQSQGITLDQTATYQLVSLDGDRAAIKTTLSQNAANQKIQNPVMPGMQTELIKMVATGTGDFSLLLTQILPSTGTIEFHSEVNMDMNMGAQKQPMTMKADVTVALQPK